MRFDLTQCEFVDTDSGLTLPAVDDGSEVLDWSAFRQAVMQWVKRAITVGIRQDIPVVIHGHKEAAFLVAMTGCMMIGAPFVPVDTSYPEARLERIKLSLGDHYLYNVQGDALNDFATENSRPLEQKNLAYIIFTSGSTGEPKGVQIGREGVVSLVKWMEEHFQLGNAPIFMNQAPFSFDLSMYEVMATLSMGGCCVMNSREVISDSATFLLRQKETGITTWVSTPSFAFQQLLNKQFCADFLPILDTFLFCGEPLVHSVAKRLRERFPHSRILNTYGPTEATVATTLIEIDDTVLATHNPLPVGFGKPDSRVFLDAETSELCIAGDHVMRGYLNRSDLNASKLFEYQGQRAFRTGDLGEIRDDGLIFCRGRIDDQIKLNGYRIELSEIDSALHRVEGVLHAATAALRRPDGSVGRVVSFVVTKQTRNQTASPEFQSACLAALSRYLPSYMIPSEILLVNSLPLSANDKVDRKKLVELYRTSPR